MYNEGISISADVLDTGMIYDVIKKSGNSYSYKDIKLGVGRENAKRYLKENPKLIKELKKIIWKEYKSSE